MWVGRGAEEETWRPSSQLRKGRAVFMGREPGGAAAQLARSGSVGPAAPGSCVLKAGGQVLSSAPARALRDSLAHASSSQALGEVKGVRKA